MSALAPHAGGLYVDATVGGGGHAARILEAATPGGRLLGLDADATAIARTAARLAPYGERAILRHSNFESIADVARESGFAPLDGVLFDLGLSSHQLADDERSFSFRSRGALDMRFDTRRGSPAAALVAELDESQLADVFQRYGEERFATRIARSIVRRRAQNPIRTGADLAAVVEAASPGPRGGRRIHPATRVFQALRIAVNRELEVLPTALAAALDLLKPGGHLVVLSYHSLEDRIVKRFLAAERRGCVCPPEVPVCVCGHTPRLAPVGRTPARPSQHELERNPRARSARLRAARRLAA